MSSATVTPQWRRKANVFSSTTTWLFFRPGKETFVPEEELESKLIPHASLRILLPFRPLGEEESHSPYRSPGGLRGAGRLDAARPFRSPRRSPHTASCCN